MKAVIIEDEPLAVDNLKYYLRNYPIEIIGSACNINDATKLIKKEKPDVVFLDINLSGENGFDLLDRIEINFKLVFVTAYNEYAVRAFEVNALDYILKPLKKARIQKTIERLFKEENEQELKNKYNMDDVIFLSSGNKASFVKVKDISYVEAESNYSKVFLTSGETKVLAKTLKKCEEMLPRYDFLRIHRSYLVNVNCIGKIKKRINGTCLVVMSGTNNLITISRRCASEIRNRLT